MDAVIKLFAIGVMAGMERSIRLDGGDRENNVW